MIIQLVEFRRSLMVALALSVSVMVTFVPANRANAGNIAGELQYRYRCNVDKQWVDLENGISKFGVTIELAASSDGTMRLVADDVAIREQPFEVVAFEYFAACELGAIVSRTGSLRDLIRGRKLDHELIQKADCLSIRRMAKEGILRGYREFDAILKVLEFQRAKRNYYGVSFERRAAYLRRNCPP